MTKEEKSCCCERVNSNRETAIQYLQQKMEYTISIYLVLVVLFLTPIAQPACLSPTEFDGVCSACKDGQSLLSGYCISPFTGCLTQLSLNLCATCQEGFYLLNNRCLAFGSDPSQGSRPEDVQPYLKIPSNNAPDYRYELINLYFKNKYAVQLADKVSNPSQLVQLQTTYGSLYSLTYTSPSSTASLPYKAEALIGYLNNITEFAFVAVNGSDYLPLWFIDRKVIVENLANSRGAILHQIMQKSSNDYLLRYMTVRGEVWAINVQSKTDAKSPFLQNLTRGYYLINENTTINYVFSLFPNLQLHKTLTVNYYSTTDSQNKSHDYYRYVFDAQIVVVIEINELILSLHSYEEPDNLLKLVTQPVSNKTANSKIKDTPAALGGYQPFLDLNDPYFLKTYNFLIDQYPLLANKNIVSVRYQVVAGINYLILLNNYPFSDEQYSAIVGKPLGTAPPMVLSLFRNGIDILNTILPSPFPAGVYNYEADPTFRKLYTYFRQVVSPQIISILPISSVQRFSNTNLTIDYLVFYNSAESAVLRYDLNQDQPYSVLSYTVDGIPIPLTATLPATSSLPTRTTILSFLKTSKPSLFRKFLVIHTKFSNSIYQLDLLTQYGTYSTRLRLRYYGLLSLSAITSTSDYQCSDLDSSEYTANSDVNTLVSYAITSYSQLKGFILTLVQGYISETGAISYRMVFANQSGGRYELQTAFTGGKFTVNKITSMQGSKCDDSSVLVKGICQKSCQLFMI